MSRISLDDTIVAIATAMGQGGIGVIRLSGKKSVIIADKLFVTKRHIKPSQFKSYTAHYGWVVKGQGTKEEIVDEALLTVMRAPKTYTREDTVEISCHGGMMILKKILQLTVNLGARLAEPGEFTKRAYLNGRIDLAQAEAVLDIIQSKTDTFLKVSLHQLKGELTAELEAIREILTNLYIEIEAIVNFPEDDINASARPGLSQKLNAANTRVKKLLASGEEGKVLKEGIKVVLCGKPNVGKSSLLNVLLKQPRAIVTNIAGTTRDTIEETAQIRGIPFQLVDTAGILKPRNLIEREAVKRSRTHIQTADLVLFVLDADRPVNKEDKLLMNQLKDRNYLVVMNKCDLNPKISEKRINGILKDKKILKVSALKKIGIKQLEEAVVDNVWHGKTVDTSKVLVSNVRHMTALKSCSRLLWEAAGLLKNNSPLELVSEEIKEAVNFLDNITGRNVDADLLERIFAEFCIGK